MALTDIQTNEKGLTALEINRGNIGSVIDSIARGLNEFLHFLTVPAEADVKQGVQYGQQAIEKTGTFAGAGGNIFVLSD